MAARVGCPIRGKLFGHAVPCARRAQNSLGRVLAFLYTTDCCPRLFCLARCQGTRIGCRLRQAIRARSALRPQGAKLLRARARLYLPVPFLLCTHSSSHWLPHKGQAIRARSALRPQGAKLLRARARLCLPVPFLLCAHGSSNWLPRRGKLFGHAVPCARRAQNSLGRVLAFLYTTDCCPRLFCLARCQGTRIGCRLRQAIRAHSALRPQGAKLLRAPWRVPNG